MNIKAVISSLSVIVVLGMSTAVHAQNGMAMTWKNKLPQQLITSNVGKAVSKRIVIVGCSGCNAYKGETSIQEERRILCIVPGNKPEPAAYAALIAANNPFKKFYYNWSGGQIGLTKPIMGTKITSQAVGDKYCKAGLGDPKARMLEHHDNRVGGWNVGGFMHPNSKAKNHLKKPKLASNKPKKANHYWVRIKNQPANPWN